MPAPTDSQQSDTPAETRRRRRPPTWLLIAAGVLAVAAAVTLLRGGAAERQWDMSTPEGAAEAFASAAAAGDVEGILSVTCLGNGGCAAEHGGGVTTEQIDAAKKVVADHVRDLGGEFASAQFSASQAGTQPGTREVDYRLPGMPEEERHYLVFVKHQDRWLYIATGGGPSAR